MTDDLDHDEGHEVPADPTGSSVVRKGMVDLERTPDDEVNSEALIAYVAERIPFDEAAERRRKAVALIANERRPGATAPDGQLHLPTIDPYDYEPDRLVMSTDRGLVENHRAKPGAKSAEAKRKMKHLLDVTRQTERSTVESSEYGEWALEETRRGTEWTDITFGRFVREAGFHVLHSPPS